MRTIFPTSRPVVPKFLATLATLVCLSVPAVAAEAESVVLATGYATAFQQIARPTASIIYLNEADSEVISNIRDVTASGGVLVVRLRDGTRQALDPARIVRMTAP